MLENFFFFVGELLNTGICISGIRPTSGGVNLPKWTNSRFWPISAQYTVHSTQYTVHSTQYTVHSTQYTVHSTQCILMYFDGPLIKIQKYIKIQNTQNTSKYKYCHHYLGVRHCRYRLLADGDPRGTRKGLRRLRQKHSHFIEFFFWFSLLFLHFCYKFPTSHHTASRRDTTRVQCLLPPCARCAVCAAQTNSQIATPRTQPAFSSATIPPAGTPSAKEKTTNNASF